MRSLGLVVCVALVLSLSACRDSKESAAGPYPARTQLDGAPDSCELLFAADPAQLLGPLAPAERFYGLCLVQPKDAKPTEAERSIGLEIRSDAANVAADLDEFWEHEGNGVGMAGGQRSEIEPLPGLGDYALWHPVDGGLRLFAYWQHEFVLVLTVKGVPRDQALPWALAVARVAVKQGPASASR